jgi:hypothetical protein
MVDQMEKEANAVRAQCFKMAWHMRGGGTYEDIMQMSIREREMIAELIKDNIETTNKTKLPWF